jgi:hypothetical protein
MGLFCAGLHCAGCIGGKAWGLIVSLVILCLIFSRQLVALISDLIYLLVLVVGGAILVAGLAIALAVYCSRRQKIGYRPGGQYMTIPPYEAPEAINGASYTITGTVRTGYPRVRANNTRAIPSRYATSRGQAKGQFIVAERRDEEPTWHS